MVYKEEKALAIGIVWEQLEWGGVDSYLGYLLSDWPNKDDVITIYYNKGNKGAQRLQTITSDLGNVHFVEVSSYFISYGRSNLFSRLVKVFTYLVTPFLFLLAALQYKKLFIDKSPDVVMVQNGGYPGSYGNISAIFGAAWAGVPVRTLVIHHAATKPDLFHGWFRLLMEKKLAVLLSSLVTVSNVTKESVLRNTRITDDQKCYVTVIDNGVPVSKSTVERYDQTEKGVIIGILGRLEPYKGHDDFLCALSMLSKECLKRVRVEFIGGYDEADLLRLSQIIESLGLMEQVVIRGFVENDISNIVRKYDLVAMTTKTFEGFGLTILEALNNGVPVLATRVGIISELFPSDSSLIVDVGDIQGMTRALERFILSEKREDLIPEMVKKRLWRYDSRYMAKRYREHLTFEHLKSVATILNKDEDRA